MLRQERNKIVEFLYCEGHKHYHPFSKTPRARSREPLLDAVDRCSAALSGAPRCLVRRATGLLAHRWARYFT
jgi:hypothetical protein